MKLLCFALTFSLLSSACSAQLHDNTWLLGYATGQGPGDDIGISQLSFKTGMVQVQENFEYANVFDKNNIIFSDSVGNIVALFNGRKLYDKTFGVMKNGDSLWNETLPYLYGYCSEDFPQGGLFLTWPDNPDSLILFYNSQGNAGTTDSVSLASLHLQYALIRRSGNNGLGEIQQRRVVIIEDSIQYGRISACKHANGRDWWILINERNSNRYYRLLLDPLGIHLLEQQTIGLPVWDGLGQAVFSPDGKTYAIFNAVDDNIGDYLDVFDFDRGTGYLNNQQHIHYSNVVGGCAISPNSRYLYVNFRVKLYQYDLYANDLDASKVLVGEYVPPAPGEAYPTFYQMQLAPDGKIYMCATSTIKALHVIHRPDEPGLDCQFESSGIKLPVRNSFSVTCSPYYRLGPLDDSSYDTLGINNYPVAWYRNEQDTLDPLLVEFRDLSYYEPTTWSWDFGDGSVGSSERYPIHTYEVAGIYQVCLSVSNINGSNTHCKTLYVGVSSLENPVLQSQILVWPNPFNDRIVISLCENLSSPIFQLYDQIGRLVSEQRLSFGITEISTDDLLPGMYFWELTADRERVKSGKVVKTRQ